MNGPTSWSNRSDQLSVQFSNKPNWWYLFRLLMMKKHHQFLKYKMKRNLLIMKPHQSIAIWWSTWWTYIRIIYVSRCSHITSRQTNAIRHMLHKPTEWNNQQMSLWWGHHSFGYTRWSSNHFARSNHKSSSLHDFENRLLPNDCIMIRNHGEEFNTLGEELEGVVDQQGSPSQVGSSVQFEFKYASASRTSQC